MTLKSITKLNRKRNKGQPLAAGFTPLEVRVNGQHSIAGCIRSAASRCAGLPLTGFTLMDLIIYTAIAAIILSILAGLSIQLIAQLNRSSARAQVQREIVSVIERLKQEAHFARSINDTASIVNVHPGKLQLNMPVVNINPTIFETVVSGSGQRLTIRQGTGPQQFLTSEAVDVDRLVFYDLSTPLGPSGARNVRAVIRLKYRNPDNLADLMYSMTATTSIELINR